MSVRANFISKFKLNDLELFRNDNWTLSIRPQQLTFGSAIISFNRDVFSLSELSNEDYIALRSIICTYEELFRNDFHATKFNYFCLMMLDPIVHFHAFPRFEYGVGLSGFQCLDSFYPNPLNVNTKEDSIIDAFEVFNLVNSKYV